MAKKTTLTSWSDAERTLESMAKLQSFIANMEADMNRDITTIKAKYGSATVEQRKQLLALEADLEAFAIQNKTEFEKSRSKEFNHGILGFRFGKPKAALFNRKFSWDIVLDLVKTKFGKAYIRTSYDVNKEAILNDYASGKLTDSALSVVGIKIDQDERFYYEIKWEELENAS